MTDPLVALAVIATLGVGSQLLASRIRVPSILLLLLSGLLAGPVFNIIDPDQLFGDLLFPAVSLGVGILLFEGGLELRREEAAEVGKILPRLVLGGMVITWIIAGLAVWALFRVEGPEAFLISSVVVVTGPTVIMPILRSVKVRPGSASLLKWEGILIDPVGALLAVVVFEALVGRESASDAVIRIVLTLGGGAIIGALMAFLLSEAFVRHWVPDRLHNAVTFMCVVLAFVLADQIQHDAGLTATTIMGVFLANQRRVPVAHIAEFEEDLVVLVLGALFIVLGARVNLDAVVEFLPASLLLLAILVSVVRPLSVMITTAGTNVPMNDRVFVSAMAPRGIVAAAVASLFSLELEELGTPIPQLVPVVFTIIIGTVIIYGLSAGPVARRLGVAREPGRGVALIGGEEWIIQVAIRLQTLGVPVLLIPADDETCSLAVRNGVPVHSGKMDSHSLHTAAESVGIATVVGLSSKRELNDLATLRLAELVGRANIYALQAPKAKSVSDSDSTSVTVVSRDPFGPEVTHEYINELRSKGARVRKMDQPPRTDVLWQPLFVVDESGNATLATKETTIERHQSVIGLLGPKIEVSQPSDETDG